MMPFAGAEGDDFADHPALALPFAPKKEPSALEEPGPSNPAQLKPTKGITAQLSWSLCRWLAFMCASSCLHCEAAAG